MSEFNLLLYKFRLFTSLSILFSPYWYLANIKTQQMHLTLSCIWTMLTLRKSRLSRSKSEREFSSKSRHEPMSGVKRWILIEYKGIVVSERKSEVYCVLLNLSIWRFVSKQMLCVCVWMISLRGLGLLCVCGGRDYWIRRSKCHFINYFYRLCRGKSQGSRGLREIVIKNIVWNLRLWDCHISKGYIRIEWIEIIRSSTEMRILKLLVS